MAKRHSTLKVTPRQWELIKDNLEPELHQYFIVGDKKPELVRVSPEMETYLSISPDNPKHYIRTVETFRSRIKIAHGGMTVEDYDALLKLQNGRCGICERLPNWTLATWKRFQVDHDHKTGRIRGLLCSHCNTGLGHFLDNVNSLERAIVYINSPPAYQHSKGFQYTGNMGPSSVLKERRKQKHEQEIRDYFKKSLPV